LILRKLSEGTTEEDLLDAYPRLKVEDIQAAIGYAAVMDPRRLAEELNKIRRLGYATSDGEAIRGTIGIAVPVWNSTGQVEAALALTAVESLCNMKRLMGFLPDLTRTGENISKALGYGTGKSSADSALLS
jgi:DNA-binding IclR family transcriptional regulator